MSQRVTGEQILEKMPCHSSPKNIAVRKIQIINGPKADALFAVVRFVGQNRTAWQLGFQT